MPRRLGPLLTLPLLAVGLAACLDEASLDDALPAPPAAGRLLGLASGLPMDPRTEATLEAPPSWRLGEWWRTRFTAPPYSIEATFTQVVAGVDGEAYLVGTDVDGFDDGVLLLHFPGLGEVDPSTLGFDAHDRPFIPLRFPLALGTTWTTQWYSGLPLEAAVTHVEGARATVEMTGARSLRLTYDATLGAIASLHIDGYGGYEVIDHGYAWSSPVRVPAAQDLVFCHGRALFVQVIDLCEMGPPQDVRPPTETLLLSDAYDRVSFGLFLRDLQDTPVGPGVLHVRVEAPDGTTYEATKTPERPGMVLHPYGLEDPAGTWRVTAVAGGAGLAILEGVAYTVLDVDLGMGAATRWP